MTLRQAQDAGRGRVGIVGVGNMGGGMAGRLLDLGWPVLACDVVADKVAALRQLGAQPATVREAAAAAALIVCVVDADQSDAVLDEALPTLRPGTPVLLCPTIAPADAERLAARVAQRGGLPVDAPMSGGPARARDGSMSLMVACTDQAWQAAAALVGALSTRVFRVGDRPGDGARTKLVNNLLAGINLAGAAEAIALAQRLGLDAARTLDVIEQSSGQSWIGTDRMRRAIAGDWEPRAHATLLHKDTGLALEAARAAGFEGALGPAAHAQFDKAVRAGWGHLDDAVLLRLFAPRA